MTSIDPDGSGSSAALALTHDKAGNLRERKTSLIPADGSGNGYRKYIYTHDAWGRLVKIEYATKPNGGSETLKTVCEFEYNGLSWRTIKRSDTSTSLDSLDEKRQMYYSANWQLLEERVDENWSSGFTIDKVYQTIYGIRYIDDVVCRRFDSNADGDFGDTNDRTYYHLTDDQFSTVAVLDENARLIERVDYDSYGGARHHWAADVDGDGDQDSTDRSTINSLASGGGTAITSSSYNADCDINRDGVIDSTDYGMASATNSALAKGLISDSSVGNIFGFSGYVMNRENSACIYTIRFRHYDTSIGRWLERDPLGYIDGMNSYQYVAGSPLGAMDPLGLCIDGGGSEIPGVPEPISSPVGPGPGSGGGGGSGSGSGGGGGGGGEPGGYSDGPHGARGEKPPPTEIIKPPGYGISPSFASPGSDAYNFAKCMLDRWHVRYIGEVECDGFWHFYWQEVKARATDPHTLLDAAAIAITAVIVFVNPPCGIMLALMLAGAAVEGTNAYLYYQEEDYVNAAFSVIGMVGFLGGAANVPCFTEDTPVWTAAGVMAISSIHAGDLVWSYDEETRAYRLCEVQEVFVTPDAPIFALEIQHVDGSCETIRATAGHPFFVPDRGWVPLKELRQGDELTDVGGDRSEVWEIVPTGHVETVYNLWVEGTHTYLVGDDGVLVHNKCHGNDLASKVPATLYALLENGEHLKYGISGDLARRYAKAFLLGKELVPLIQGPRREMRGIERILNTTRPGPSSDSPMSISIGVVHGDSGSPATPMGRELRSILRLIERNRETIEEYPILNVVFLTKGDFVNPAHSGLRVQRFSKKKQALLVHAAVPEEAMHAEKPQSFILGVLREAVQVAKSEFNRRKVVFSVQDHLRFVDEIEQELKS